MTFQSAPAGTPAASTHRCRDRRPTGASIVAATALILSTLAAFGAISPPAAEALGLAGSSGSAASAASADSLASAEYPQQWIWPVPAPIRVVSPFRAPPTPYAAGHRGLDLAVEPGDAVVASAAGTVSFAGMVAGRGVVAIDHGDGVVSAIEPVDALVTAGAPVAAGDAVGIVSTGGHCGSGCAHFGVRVHGEYVSPFLFLGGLPRAVLLPAE